MVGDVPFNTSREPGSQHADEGRLDARLRVEEVIAISFIGGLKDASANLGQHTDIDILVLQPQDVVVLGSLLVGKHVVERIGIDVALGTLVDAAGEEDGVFLGGPQLIGGQGNLFLAHTYGLRPERHRQCERSK